MATGLEQTTLSDERDTVNQPKLSLAIKGANLPGVSFNHLCRKITDMICLALLKLGMGDRNHFLDRLQRLKLIWRKENGPFLKPFSSWFRCRRLEAGRISCAAFGSPHTRTLFSFIILDCLESVQLLHKREVLHCREFCTLGWNFWRILWHFEKFWNKMEIFGNFVSIYWKRLPLWQCFLEFTLERILRNSTISWIFDKL